MPGKRSRRSKRTRREFLALCGAVAGSFLVSAAVARIVSVECILARRPYLPAPSKPGRILSAIAMEQTPDTPYLLALGDPRDPVPVPSLRDYLRQFECLDTHDQVQVRSFCRRHIGEPEDGDTWDEYLSRPISGSDLILWELWWEGNCCPTVLAHRMLKDLPLDDGNGAPSHQPLADLVFAEGEWHGPWRDHVEAANLAALACLQHRLNELGQNVAIRIEDW